MMVRLATCALVAAAWSAPVAAEPDVLGDTWASQEVVHARALAGGFQWAGRVAIDAEGLAADDPDVRLEAALRLGRYDLELSEPHLLRALADPSVEVRLAAGRILGRGGSSEVADVVLAWLGRSDARERRAAIDILGQIGDPDAVQPLIRALGDPDDEVRLRAVRALGALRDADVVVPLIARLEDSSAEIRRAAARELADIGDRRALAPIVGLFDDATQDTKTAAIEAAGRLGDASALPPLRRLLDSSEEVVGAAAAAALGELGDAEVIPDLVERLGEGSEELRGRVAFALARIATRQARREGGAHHAERATRALAAGLADRALREAAREALLAAGEVAVPTLIAVLDGEVDGDVEVAIELLRELGDTRATDALVRELSTRRVSRDLVLDALLASGDERALLPTLELLDADDPGARRSAMRALGPMITGDARAADVIAERLDDDDPDTRLLAARHLGAMGARSAVAELEAIVRNHDEPRGLRREAISSLGAIGAVRAAPALAEILAGAEADLHRDAADALIHIGDPGVAERLAEVAEARGTPGRHHAVRALGGSLRGSRDHAARPLLAALARGSDRRLALAALEALAAIGDPEAAADVARVAGSSDGERRRAALAALGALDATDAVTRLARYLTDPSDRVRAAAAWSLGLRLAAAESPDRERVADLERLAKRGGPLASINASAALAHLAHPSTERALRALLLHSRAPVRANAAAGLGGLRSEMARSSLVGMLRSDESAVARAAAARALSQIGGADPALAERARADRDERVRAAAASPFEPPPRIRYTSFTVVHAGRGDRPATGEPYLLVAADGIATAHITDSRGIIPVYRMPEGSFELFPKHRTDAPAASARGGLTRRVGARP